MKFKYKAKTSDGELQVGFIEAQSRDSAAGILAGHNLFILSLESGEARHWYDVISEFFGRVKRKDLAIFTRQLATLLEARLPLSDTLKILYEQTKQPTLKDAVYQMTEDIDAGLSFSQAMGRQGNIFPQFYIEMVQAAEITGNLNEMAVFLADYAEKEDILIGRARSALIYPGLVVGLFLVMGFIMVTFVFPKIGPVFEEAHVALPFYTKILLGSGAFLGKWWLAVIISVVALAVLILDYADTKEGQAFFDDSKIRLPLISKIYKPLILTRFANAAALLMHGGIPIAQTLSIISTMVGNVLYKDVITDIAEDVRQGKLLSESIEKYPNLFPSIVPQMVAVGETTGQIEQVFNRLAGFYGREADAIMGNIVDLVQPFLMIGVGLLVGLLFASIIIPLYQLTATFG